MQVGRCVSVEPFVEAGDDEADMGERDLFFWRDVFGGDVYVVPREHSTPCYLGRCPCWSDQLQKHGALGFGLNGRHKKIVGCIYLYEQIGKARHEKA